LLNLIEQLSADLRDYQAENQRLRDEINRLKKALISTLYFGMNAREPKMLEFFEYVGIHISEGELSNLLIKDQEGFHTEKEFSSITLPVQDYQTR
jgi:hypothetical protein